MAVIQTIKTGKGINTALYKEIMIEDQADLADIDPKTIGIGSIAYTCKTGQMGLDYLYMWNGEAWCQM